MSRALRISQCIPNEAMCIEYWISPTTNINLYIMFRSKNLNNQGSMYGSYLLTVQGSIKRGRMHVFFVFFCTHGALFFQIVQKNSSTKKYKKIQINTKKYKKFSKIQNFQNYSSWSFFYLCCQFHDYLHTFDCKESYLQDHQTLLYIKYMSPLQGRAGWPHILKYCAEKLM